MQLRRPPPTDGDGPLPAAEEADSGQDQQRGKMSVRRTAGPRMFHPDGGPLPAAAR